MVAVQVLVGQGVEQVAGVDVFIDVHRHGVEGQGHLQQQVAGRPTGPALAMLSGLAYSAIRLAVVPSVTPSTSTSAEAMPHCGVLPVMLRRVTATGRLPV